jgi:hypothetical protein
MKSFYRSVSYRECSIFIGYSLKLGPPFFVVRAR